VFIKKSFSKNFLKKNDPLVKIGCKGSATAAPPKKSRGGSKILEKLKKCGLFFGYLINNQITS